MAVAACNPHAADVLSSYLMAYGHHPCSGGSGADFYGEAFGTGPAQLDAFDCLSDEGVPAASVPACTFGTTTPPPPMLAVERLVADAAGYGHTTTQTRSAAAVAGEAAATDCVRIAFRTRSEVEILDDGYRWRKYGKKSVKNSPNPRNYYRCSTEGCNVKKRVERERDDPSYVVTMYEGVHNHASPGTIYYATQDAVSGRFFVAGMHQHHTGS
ncbi:hypothetical protein ACP4OV_029627 [Aristida adscensionis]